MNSFMKFSAHRILLVRSYHNETGRKGSELGNEEKYINIFVGMSARHVLLGKPRRR
jgi:hypothetical protein